jgi:hypothetical protein
VNIVITVFSTLSILLHFINQVSLQQSHEKNANANTNAWMENHKDIIPTLYTSCQYQLVD